MNKYLDINPVTCRPISDRKKRCTKLKERIQYKELIEVNKND